MKKILMIGSIVKINTSDDKFMISGYSEATDLDEKGKYLVIHYPDGLTYNQRIILIGNEDIEEVLYEGYRNKKYVKMMSEALFKSKS